jgi:hypothetical protein
MLKWRSQLKLTDEEIEKFCRHTDWTKGVHKHKDGTYWWYDELESDECGPFLTFLEAHNALKKYAESL